VCHRSRLHAQLQHTLTIVTDFGLLVNRSTSLVRPSYSGFLYNWISSDLAKGYSGFLYNWSSAHRLPRSIKISTAGFLCMHATINTGQQQPTTAIYLLYTLSIYCRYTYCIHSTYYAHCVNTVYARYCSTVGRFEQSRGC